jgi:serine/threonine protein phosphatase 1
MRTILIGDIHGCYNEFKKLIDTVEIRKNDNLVLLGDLFDRGPDSYRVYEYVRYDLMKNLGSRLTYIRGNHEDMLLDSKLNHHDYPLWECNGAKYTINSFKKNGKNVYDIVDWIIKNSLLYKIFPNFQCCHASPGSGDLEHEHYSVLIWDRSEIVKNTYSQKLTFIGHTPTESDVYQGKGNREALESLTNVRKSKAENGIYKSRWMPLPKTGLIDIDTGCVFGQYLTAAIVENDRVRFVMIKSNYKY